MSYTSYDNYIMTEKNYESIIRILERELRAAKAERVQQIQEAENRLLSEGWKKFTFSSVYCGSHYEYGEDDVQDTYLFHPDVDFSRWTEVTFVHGHHNDDWEEWEKWYNSIPDDKKIEVTIYHD